MRDMRKRERDTEKRAASNQTRYDTRKHAQTESRQAIRRFSN